MYNFKISVNLKHLLACNSHSIKYVNERRCVKAPPKRVFQRRLVFEVSSRERGVAEPVKRIVRGVRLHLKKMYTNIRFFFVDKCI